MSRILVTGSSNGLGRELVNILLQQHHIVHEYDLADGCDVCVPNLARIEELDVLINNAGVNDIDWLEYFTSARWDHIMDTNTKGIFMMSQACLPMLAKSRGTIVNIVSNAASVPMRCSLAYNASKAAAHMMTLQLARELTPKHGITVFGIAPNKMAGTRMSQQIDRAVQQTRGWSPEQAEAYQRQSLLTGRETPPEAVADFIAFLLSDKTRHEYLSGCVLPYGA